MSHKMRSVLTMLGIIIGIASIIAIVSIIQATSDMLKGSLVGTGNNTVKMCFYDKNDSWSVYNTYYNGKIEGVSEIPDEAIEQINELDGVVNTSAYYFMEYSLDIYYNAKSTYESIYGVQPEFLDMYGLKISKGRGFTQDDIDKKNKVVILDTSDASALFENEDPIGKSITINNEMFVVVGIAEKPIDYDSIDSLSDYYTAVGYNNGGVYMPASCWSLIAGYDDIESLLIKIETVDDSVAVGANAAEILNAYCINPNFEYKSSSLQEDMQSLEQITMVISILLVGIASISLLVGGIGVMNIMLVSVTERTKEIGLKKALGAKRSRILAQFLTEAVVLTCIGGIIGVLLGLGMAAILGLVFGMSVGISIPAIAVSVGFSMIVGIIFGLVPSIKASKLDPIVALRYE